jgi:hypothetical protein
VNAGTGRFWCLTAAHETSRQTPRGHGAPWPRPSTRHLPPRARRGRDLADFLTRLGSRRGDADRSAGAADPAGARCPSGAHGHVDLGAGAGLARRHDHRPAPRAHSAGACAPLPGRARRRARAPADAAGGADLAARGPAPACGPKRGRPDRRSGAPRGDRPRCGEEPWLAGSARGRGGAAVERGGGASSVPPPLSFSFPSPSARRCLERTGYRSDTSRSRPSSRWTRKRCAGPSVEAVPRRSARYALSIGRSTFFTLRTTV